MRYLGALVSGGTDTHHVVIDLRSHGIDAAHFVELCDEVGILARVVGCAGLERSEPTCCCADE